MATPVAVVREQLATLKWVVIVPDDGERAQMWRFFLVGREQVVGLLYPTLGMTWPVSRDEFDCVRVDSTDPDDVERVDRVRRFIPKGVQSKALGAVSLDRLAELNERGLVSFNQSFLDKDAFEARVAELGGSVGDDMEELADSF